MWNHQPVKAIGGKCHRCVFCRVLLLLCVFTGTTVAVLKQEDRVAASWWAQFLIIFHGIPAGHGVHRHEDVLKQ